MLATSLEVLGLPLHGLGNFLKRRYALIQYNCRQVCALDALIVSLYSQCDAYILVVYIH